ncbi:MAG: YkvA family protein [Planctomycetota bacterium]
MSPVARWKQWAEELTRETFTLYFACRDPRTPWYAKTLALCVVGYAFSPIDLIPDPIPIIGHLDDLVLVPLGVALVRRLVPQEVMVDCRGRARTFMDCKRPKYRVAAVAVVLIWLALAVVGGRLLWNFVT